MRYRIADLFCGAGGTSAGAVEAAAALGRHPEVTAVNHWPVAIETHTANHPGARHLCTGVDSINPRELFGEGELDLLWASPECTHHSVARGGKPINDQSRATAWCVVRWAEALLPPVILIENVPEFQTWGPLIRKRQLIKVEVPSMPYRKWRRQQVTKGVSAKSLLSRVVWWNKVGLETKEVPKLVWVPDPKRKGEIFKAWVATLEAIGYKVDFRLLCAADYGDPTTRTRLFVQAVRGRRRIVWPEATHSKNPDLLATRRWTPAREIIDWSLPAGSIFERKKPLSPKTLARIEAGLRKFGLKDFIVPQQSNPTPKSVDDPLPTVVAEGSGPKLVQPFIVPQFGEREGQQPRTHDVEQPLPAVTSHGAGALVQPYIVAWDHTSGGAGAGVSSIEDPLSTVVTKARHGVAEPFLVELRGTGNGQIPSTAKSLDDPCGTITAGGVHHGLVSPFLIKTANGSNGSDESRVKSVDEPMPTVCGNRGDVALIEPCLMGQQSCAALRPISEPAPTVSTAGAIALVEPFLVSYYGTGGARDINAPLDTVTTKDRLGLVRPVVEIDGSRYLLDIRFRMLQPHELALAQGFPKEYRFTGTKTDQVKQIGNAVPRRLARAIVGAVLSQNPDVSHLVDAEEARNGKEAA